MVIGGVLAAAPEILGSKEKPVQPVGIVFAFGMNEVDGVGIDLSNVRKTFESLNFAVHCVESTTSSQLVSFIEAAATYKYPLKCKHRCFYFAGHGGMDKQQRPFFKPISKEEGEIFVINENIFSRFKNAKACETFVFFFDCCLSPKNDESPFDIDRFELNTPRRCLVAHATYIGLKSFGDKEQGGRWTHCLCKNLEEQAELGEVLAKTHDDVMKISQNTQPPQFHSCVGPIYLKGITGRLCMLA